MLQNNSYIIAQGVFGADAVDKTGIDYTPQAELSIGIWKYARSGPDFEGAGYSPAEILQFRRGKLRKLNAEWFVPFLERMAQGEEVSIEEINAHHMELFGKELQKVSSPYPPQCR